MICRTSLTSKFLPCVMLALLIPPILSAADPDADELLQAARVTPLNQNITLNAKLRKQRDETHFQIRVADAIHYVFPDYRLTLELKDDSSRLLRSDRASSTTIRPARYDELIEGTDISYEDLALKFLYWRNPKIIGNEKIKGQRCYIIELQAPRTASQYGAARLWISRDSGALMRMQGYDNSGRLIRRFEVRSAQKIDGQWMLKQMRIERLNPETKRVTSRTYLEVLGKDSG